MADRSVHEATALFLEKLASPGPGNRRRGLSSGLLLRLGCPALVFSGEEDILVENNVESHSEDDLSAIKICLPQIVCAAAGTMKTIERACLLAGLYRHDCWRTCLETTAGADALALALVGYVGAYQDMGMGGQVAPDVLALINAWLRPEPPWADASAGPSAICRILFGDAWAALAIQSDLEGRRRREVAAVVRAQRPSLQPGLCPSQTHTTSMPLPDLTVP